MQRLRYATGLALLMTAMGCSPKDPPTNTPIYHQGVKTNSSSVNSWELNREPRYTQPGINSGKSVTLQPIPSQRGFEPNDPLAEQVYAALQSDSTLDARYLSASAKEGIVILRGTVPTAALKAHAEETARHVPGVRVLRSLLTVRSSDGGAP